MNLRKTTTLLGVLASGLVVPVGKVNAATVYQTPSWPQYNCCIGSAVSSSIEIASSFTVSGGDFVLDTASFHVRNNDDVNDFDVSLWSSSAGAPGTALETITGVLFPVTSGTQTVTFSGTTQLLNGTEYWVGLAPGDPGANLTWNWDGAGGTRATRSPPGSGSWTVYTNGTGSFEVTGTVVPVPAAAWMGLALLGGIGGYGFVRLRIRSH